MARGDDRMSFLLETGTIIMHPFVVGEIALGHLPRRIETVSSLMQMRMVPLTDPVDMLSFIQNNKIFGSGIGYVDAHLLAASTLAADVQLWTRDKKLRAVAERLSIAAQVE